MNRKKFKLWHSLLGTVVLILIELVIVHLNLPVNIAEALILIIAAVGSIINIYVATEAVEEVRGSMHMFLILFVVMMQFIVFFAFEYGFLLHVDPSSFPTLTSDPVTLLLASVMGFVFNPLYLPGSGAGRALLLIDTAGGLGLVLFVLQNIAQFRRKSLDEHS